MAYIKTTWLSGVAPPISAANLNNLETQYDEAVAEILLRVVKDVDEDVTSSIVMQNDDELLLPVAANIDYAFQAIIIAFSASATPNFRFTFTAPSGASGGFNQVSSSAVPNLLSFTTENVATNLDGSIAKIVTITGHIVVGGTPGNLQFQWAQGTSDGTATTVKAGSALILYS